MKKRLSYTLLAILAGVVLAVLSLWLSAASPVQANPDIRYVATTGSDSSNNCTNPSTPCKTIQHAIDVATSGDEIRVAGGTYIRNGTLAAINKELSIVGAFGPSFNEPAPELYQTVLDAQWGGSVVSITNTGNVALQFLTLTHGNGAGNYYSTVGCGGGVYVKDSILHMGGSLITNNVGSKVGNGWGGGLCARESNIDMWGSMIVSNTANPDSSASTTSYGGGMYVVNSSGVHGVRLEGNQFLDNVGHTLNQGRGGGVYLVGLTSAELLTNTIRGNKSTLGNATSGWGGGLDIENCSGVNVTGNRIENNVTHPNPSYGGYGGGVYVYKSDLHLRRNAIIANRTTQGGGVFIRSERPVTLSNNLIALNGPFGGGVHVTEYYTPSVSQAILVNNTIVDNDGSGIAVYYYAIVTLTNNIVAGHAKGLDTWTPFYGTISATTNLFWNTSDPITGTNGIRQDPRLTANYHLEEGSPALNAGLTIPWLTVDLDGKSRPQEGIYDIGAYEGIWREIFLPLVLKN